MKEHLKLHLGCGHHKLNGWVNIDSVHLPQVDVVANLENCATTPLPFERDSVSEIYASHLIEHVNNILPLMQELYRVAISNATMVLRVPYGSSDDAWEDPTHVRPYFLQSFGYFSMPYYHRARYEIAPGILYSGDWQPDKLVLRVPNATSLSDAQVMQEVFRSRNVVTEMIAYLHAVKPARQPLKSLQRQPEIVLERV